MHQPLPHPRPPSEQPPEMRMVCVVEAVDGVDRLPAPIRRIINLCDGRRTVAQVVADARFSEERSLAVIRKLTREGYIDLRPEEQRRLERADTLRDLPCHRRMDLEGFTPDEEAFFASEVEPAEEELPPTLGERLGLLLADLRMRLTNSPA